MTSSFASGGVVPPGAGAGSGAFFSSDADWVVPSVGAGGVSVEPAGAGGGVSVSAASVANEDRQVNATMRHAVLFISGTSQLQFVT